MTERFTPGGGLPPRGPLALAQPAPYVPKADCLRAWVAFHRAQYTPGELPTASWLARKTGIRRSTVIYLAAQIGVEIAKREPPAQKSVNG